VPRRLENDRWLFGTTIALCLIGVVMILSASAVTAEQQYHHSYYFLARQAAWLLLAAPLVETILGTIFVVVGR